MNSSTCPDCASVYDPAVGHTCAAAAPDTPAAAPDAANSATAGDAADSLPENPSDAAPVVDSSGDGANEHETALAPAEPYVPTLPAESTVTPATGDLATPNESAAWTSGAFPMPPMPSESGDDGTAFVAGGVEPRYIAKVVWLNVLWAVLTTIVLAFATFGIGALLMFLIGPIVFGVRMSKATDALSRSRYLGWLLGVLCAPIIAAGICFGNFLG